MRFVSFLLFLLFPFSGLCFLSAQSDTVQRSSLEGYTVHGGVNPAFVVMQQTVERRAGNSAYNSQSFKYVAYHKMTVYPSFLSDSLKSLDSQHLFLSESVSEVLFKSPSKHYERMVASRTSGMKNAMLNLAFSHLQFQNLYAADRLKILEVEYVSPISKGALKLYDFEMLDTIVSEGDTLYQIRYVHKNGLTFKSLRGQLWIHGGDYGIQRIEAVPTEDNMFLRMSVSHDYARAENGLWFPQRMEARFPFPRIAVARDTLEAVGVSVITVKNLEIDVTLRNSDFGVVDVEEDIVSESKSAALLSEFRDTLLTDKELRTYDVLDSLSRKLKLEKKLDLLPSLMRGCIPIGPIDLDLTSIVDYSYNEGWRLGLGLYTNQRLARFCTLGGYFAYGLKDKAWKWGVRTDWELYRKHSLMLKIRVFDDIVESGSTQLVSRDESGLLNGEYYRHWIITKYDHSRAGIVQLQMRADKNFTVSASAGYSWNTTLYNYQYLPHPMGNSPFYTFRNFYVRAGVRFAYHETTYRSRDFSLYDASKFPTVQVLYEHGFSGVFGSAFSYNKINARIHHLQRYKILGYSEIAVVGGWLDRSLPYSLLYVMPAGYEKLGFYGAEQFAVMRPNEFVTDGYVALFFRHNFGKMWEGRFSPRIVLCQNIGFGWLRWRDDHAGVGMRSMEKGYFETGVMIDNIIAAKDILAMGIGVFYRYGAYAMEKVKDNFAIKVSLTVPMAE